MRIEHIGAGRDGRSGDAVATALLRATDELYEQDAVSDANWSALEAELDTKQLLDVLIAIGGYCMLSMAMNSFGVQLDPNATRFPPHLR